MSRPNRVDVFFVLLCAAVFSLGVTRYWGYVNDDAFISFRYAANLLAGDGLTYNPGARVEGYTNFLWVILTLPFLRLGGEEQLLALMKFVGIGFGLGTIVLTYACGRRLFESRTAPLVASLLLSASPPFCCNAVSGLETMLFVFLVTLALLFRLGSEHRHDLGFAFAMALASLTRPEGFYFFGLLLAFHPIARVSWRRTFAVGAAYATVVVPYLGWKLAYYGSLLPNTFYAKPGILADGWRHVLGFLLGAGFTRPVGLPLVPLVVGLFGLRRSSGWPAAFLVVSVSAVVVSGGDWMMGWRFLVPALPAGLLVTAAGVDWLHTRLKPWRPGVALAASVAILALLLVAFDQPRKDLEARAHGRGEGQRAAHLEIGRWLRHNARTRDSIALTDIGMVGFFSGLRVIDLSGLTDAHIGHSPGSLLHKRYDPSYVLDQRPEFIVLVSTKPLRPRRGDDAALGSESWGLEPDALWFQDRRIAEHASFARDYEPVLTRFAQFEGHLHLFRRRTASAE